MNRTMNEEGKTGTGFLTIMNYEEGQGRYGAPCRNSGRAVTSPWRSKVLRGKNPRQTRAARGFGPAFPAWDFSHLSSGLGFHTCWYKTTISSYT